MTAYPNRERNITTRLPGSTAAKVRELAATEDRPISQVVRRIVIAALEPEKAAALTKTARESAAVA